MNQLPMNAYEEEFLKYIRGIDEQISQALCIPAPLLNSSTNCTALETARSTKITLSSIMDTIRDLEREIHFSLLDSMRSDLVFVPELAKLEVWPRHLPWRAVIWPQRGNKKKRGPRGRKTPLPPPVGFYDSVHKCWYCSPRYYKAMVEAREEEKFGHLFNYDGMVLVKGQ